MKNLLIICITILFSSCASSYISYQNLENPDTAYRKIFVVSVFKDINLKEFDKETYNSYFHDNINDLGTMDSRRIIENSIKNQIENPRTLVNTSHKNFKVNIDINYEQFMQSVQEFDSDAILVVNETAYYYEINERIRSNGEIRKSESPNAVFHAYLIDANTLQPVWVGKIYSSGTSWDDSSSIYNSMSRQLNKKLIKEQFLVTPLHVRKS